ncbi:MAG: MATE family efflux transporter [Paludibacter sp.]
MLMQDDLDNNKRIAKNTLLLYVRSIFVLAISLYTSRVVLDVLGVKDYGIYSVVGGFVALFSIFSAAIAATIQRFLTYELGKGSAASAKDVFSASLNIQFVLAGSILILLETVGLWFLNYKMNIPSERINAANWVLQFSIITFVINLSSVPYNAAIIANERMDVFAFISILEAVLKLLVLYLLKVLLYDKIIVYALLMMGIAIVIQFVYGVYCKKKFKECRYKKVKEKTLYKDMLGISGWVFLSSSATIATVQGMDILLNLFGGGVVVNAAKGIATQVNNAVTQLVNSFMISINPQITKSYAANNQSYLLSLVDRGSRFSFYLMCMLSLPIIFETNTILSLWLKEVPEYTVAFVRLILIYIMIQPFSSLLGTTILASGSVRNSQIVLSILQIMNLPLSYLILKCGYPPYYIYFVFILISWFSLCARLIFVHNRTRLSYFSYLKNTIGKSLITVSIPIIASFIFVYAFPQSFLRLVMVLFVSELSLFSAIFFFGINRKEINFICEKIKSKRGNFCSKNKA